MPATRDLGIALKAKSSSVLTCGAPSADSASFWGLWGAGPSVVMEMSSVLDSSLSPHTALGHPKCSRCDRKAELRIVMNSSLDFSSHAGPLATVPDTAALLSGVVLGGRQGRHWVPRVWAPHSAATRSLDPSAAGWHGHPPRRQTVRSAAPARGCAPERVTAPSSPSSEGGRLSPTYG